MVPDAPKAFRMFGEKSIMAPLICFVSVQFTSFGLQTSHPVFPLWVIALGVVPVFQ
jgi:hypothetical protein